ncbi:MAG: FHA domain-containing protein, partial [Planctomycetes bacterium]|nr:FHA domain-containing protein [Planctomycetota bacterium]
MKFIVQEGDTEYEFLLSPGLYIVGRDPTCDLTLDSQRVSRRHMSCTVTEDHVTVKDLGSRNSIRIGGIKVDEATLRDGDELHVADVRLKFKGDAGGAPAIPANKKDEPVEAHEAVLEDDEETPPEGALVPEEEGGKKPEVTQKDGRWFVTDPNTGREVEIVPAGEEKTGKKSKSLLSTTKGK